MAVETDSSTLPLRRNDYLRVGDLPPFHSSNLAVFQHHITLLVLPSQYFSLNSRLTIFP